MSALRIIFLACTEAIVASKHNKHAHGTNAVLAEQRVESGASMQYRLFSAAASFIQLPMIDGHTEFLQATKLGEGTFAKVWKATLTRAVGDPPTIPVAVKVFKPPPDGDTLAGASLREVAVMADLPVHPNVLQTVGIVSIDGRLAIATQYLPGSTLAKLLVDTRSKSHVVATSSRAPSWWHSSRSEGFA